MNLKNARAETSTYFKPRTDMKKLTLKMSQKPQIFDKFITDFTIWAKESSPIAEECWNMNGKYNQGGIHGIWFRWWQRCILWLLLVRNCNSQVARKEGNTLEKYQEKYKSILKIRYQPYSIGLFITFINHKD